MTNKFPELQDAIHRIHAHTAVLECGICLRDGRSVFDLSTEAGFVMNGKIMLAVNTHPTTFVECDGALY